MEKESNSLKEVISHVGYSSRTLPLRRCCKTDSIMEGVANV